MTHASNPEMGSRQSISLDLGEGWGGLLPTCSWQNADSTAALGEAGDLGANRAGMLFPVP